MFFGPAFVLGGFQRAAQPLEDSERDVKEFSDWSHVEDFEFEIEFTCNLKKDAGFRTHISGTH